MCAVHFFCLCVGNNYILVLILYEELIAILYRYYFCISINDMSISIIVSVLLLF